MIDDADPQTALDLDALEEALAKMSPEPWWPLLSAHLQSPCGTVAGMYWNIRQNVNGDDNAAGVATLRNAAPNLIVEVRRLRKDRAITAQTNEYLWGAARNIMDLSRDAAHIPESVHRDQIPTAIKAAIGGRDARIQRLQEALEWALAEIGDENIYAGNAIYSVAAQRRNALALARAALDGKQ